MPYSTGAPEITDAMLPEIKKQMDVQNTCFCAGWRTVSERGAFLGTSGHGGLRYGRSPMKDDTIAIS